MAFYEDFSKYYDLIFQAKKPQLDFITRRTPKGGRILDVAAGTGNQALALGKEGYDLRAVEYDEKMLQVLEEKKKQEKVEIKARQGDMKEVLTYYPRDFFDTLYCIGNSLVHLTTTAEIEKFLQGAYAVLKTEGTLIIQIINYDRILDQGIKGLPTIKNEQDPKMKAEFVRRYEMIEDSNLMDFHTRLRIEKNGEEIIFEDHTPLLPLRYKELKDLLQKVGFNNLETFSSFTEESYDLKAQPLIMTGKK